MCGGGVIGAGTTVRGLDDRLSSLVLDDYLPAAQEWCEVEGHVRFEDVVENVQTLADVLCFAEDVTLRMKTNGTRACQEVLEHNSQFGASGCGGSRVRFFSDEICVEEDQSERSPRIFDENVIDASVNVAVTSNTTSFKNSKDSDKVSDGPSGRARSKSRPLRRIDTVGNELEQTQPARREMLIHSIRKDLRTVDIDEGQTGTVYALETGGDKVAVFKPLAGEHFERRGVDVGTGALREEAAYLIDRIAGSQAGVPVTSRTRITVNGEITEGSVQAFVGDVVGFAEDFGMPRDFERACAFVPQEAVEALALLDMRLFNMDRHTGNLMFLHAEKPHALGPIDHGCCLPPWWMLSEAVFDAWLEWPQLQQAPSDFARELAGIAVQRLPQVITALRDLGLSEETLVTHRVCATLIGVGVAELGLPIGSLAQLMVRQDYQELSWLEKKLLQVAQDAGILIHVSASERGVQELVVDEFHLGPKGDIFLRLLAQVFRSELPREVF
mmetsp:Transcript_35923/g.95345  ORF Transcript_35923/g.95345 Transcript_35923/m.95345 type:complete len:499 (-) Transcript_35923:375-1871(-)